MPRLATVTLLVPSYNEGLAFFVHGLGWTCIADVDQGRKRWITVSPDAGAALVLAVATTPAQSDRVGSQTGDRVGFFLETDDFDRDAARIVAAGGRFLELPRAEPYGRVAQWLDPFGNAWDLLQPHT